MTAREGRFLVGPFSSWILRHGYVSFIVPEKHRGKLAALNAGHALSTPLREIERAYVDVDGYVWLMVKTRAYDLIKHFRGRPKIRRRLASLWCFKCYNCETNHATGLGVNPMTCRVCGGENYPAIVWIDVFSHRISVGPCRVYNGRLLDDSRAYYVGEILGIQRDMLGNLYATVLSFSGASTADMRLVDVERLDEIGWRRPVVLCEG
ncbi:MAG: hypothetical protein QW362_06395 [Candidatus Caldarchaeum sp.]